MRQATDEYVAVIMNALSGIGVLLISFLVELRLPISDGIAKIAGLIIVYVGMALFIWAAIHIKSAIGGMVYPRLTALIKSGPYRFVRHPIYLGMAIALVGVAVSLRSPLGFLAVLFLSLPSMVYRARLEERALAEKFGEEWADYVKNTRFFVPFSGKE